MTNRVLALGCMAVRLGASRGDYAGCRSDRAASPKPARQRRGRCLDEICRAGQVPAETAWASSDIQGVWTSDAALGIPRERPEKFGTRDLLTDEEFADARKSDEQRRDAGVNAVGAFRNDGAWKTRSYRQTSLVVEPEDGRTPAFTEQALTRTAPRDRGSFGEGPFNDQLDFTLYDRCMTRGIVGSIMPVVYGNGNRIIQSPGVVVISYEMVHDTRVLHRRPPASVVERPSVSGNATRGHWEGSMLVIETTNFTDQTSIGGGNGKRPAAQRRSSN